MGKSHLENYWFLGSSFLILVVQRPYVEVLQKYRFLITFFNWLEVKMEVAVIIFCISANDI